MNEIKKMALETRVLFDSVSNLVVMGEILFKDFTLIEMSEGSIDYSYGYEGENILEEPAQFISFMKTSESSIGSDRGALAVDVYLNLFASDEIVGLQVIKKLAMFADEERLFLYNHPASQKEWIVKFFVPLYGQCEMLSEILAEGAVIRHARIGCSGGDYLIGNRIIRDMNDLPDPEKSMLDHTNNLLSAIYENLGGGIS